MVRLPADPTGHHLAQVVHAIGDGLHRGDTLIVDEGGVEHLSSGVLLALARLRRRARLLGVEWQRIS